MKQIVIIIFLLNLAFSSSAQLSTASVSPDFNFFDINGKQHHLYSYLSQGKVVIVNFSPAWCQECWNYHRINALKDFYTLYGPTGTNQARVIFIEKDETMELSDLQGITTATAGDWITGTPYPIIDTSAANEDFMPDALPTIYGIYPNKFLSNIGRLTTEELFTFMQEYTGPTVQPDTMIKVTLEQMKTPSCADFSDGALAISVDGPGTSYTFAWNNGDTTPNIAGLLEGVYRCTITDNLDNVHIIDPITLSDPDTLSLTFLQNTPTSETSNNGSIIANVTGGTMPYTYIWNTGGMTNTIGDLGEGNYSVQIIDAQGCQISGATELTIPDCSVVVSINVEATSCDENPDGAVNILIDGATPPVTFAWNNGANTQSLIGVPSGGYELTVTDAIGCQATVGAMVAIDDRIRPAARIRQGPIEFYLNEEGLVEISAAEIDSGSFDNCGILD
ncbi:MAG: redoxin domain-containing protein, partial [Saprospiraceae bacterium]|nr:redoxin domain-containing protein [Saprospiraceae bacterium]